MPESLRRRLARARGWVIPAALLALAPKCVLCVLAYAGVGAALGLGGREICGASADPAGPWSWLLPMLGAALGVIGFLASGRRRCAKAAGADERGLALEPGRWFRLLVFQPHRRPKVASATPPAHKQRCEHQPGTAIRGGI